MVLFVSLAIATEQSIHWLFNFTRPERQEQRPRLEDHLKPGRHPHPYELEFARPLVLNTF
jgi:hypothetical protein